MGQPIEVWTNRTIAIRGGKMRMEVSIRYDISAIRAEVGYLMIKRVYCWSGSTYEDREKDYDLTRSELGSWVEDLDKIVGELLEEKLWDAIA